LPGMRLSSVAENYILPLWIAPRTIGQIQAARSLLTLLPSIGDSRGSDVGQRSCREKSTYI
jgi:hypothetical protein